MKDIKSGERKELRLSAAFIFIGPDPNTGFVEDTFKFDKWESIETNALMEPSIEGIFAADDALSGSTKQITGSTGEGTTAVLMIHQLLEKTTGIQGY